MRINSLFKIFFLIFTIKSFSINPRNLNFIKILILISLSGNIYQNGIIEKLKNNKK